jgi:predicted GNAT family N-acyltransferase
MFIEAKIYKGLIKEAEIIRKEVFVKEQGFKDEFDEVDEKAIHIVLYDKTTEGDIPVSTCRIFKNEENQENNNYILGRLAVIKDYRKNKIGSKTVGEAEKYVKENGGKSISLHAQCVAKEFYKKIGYQEYGEVEDEQGCPHIWMRKELK